jgi:List-Bact-rpt repeat protein
MVSKTVSAKNRFLWLGLLLSYIVFMHAVTAFAGTVTLHWDAPTTNTDGTPLTDLAGYIIYYGPTSGNYTNSLDVGNVMTSVVNNLTDGLTNYFTVIAYNSAGVESSFSNEVNKTLPLPPPPPSSSPVTVMTFMITASADIGGTITPAGTTGVNYGANQTFTIAPYADYHVATVLVDGVSKGAVTTYTFTNVIAAHTIAATFTQNPASTPITYAITVTQTANGYITPYTFKNFQAGTNQTYTIAPSIGYHVDSLTVDGNAVNPPVTSYPFTNIQANHTITATFAPNPTYTVTATAGANGSISPSGISTVFGGASQLYTITPASGYRIDKVRVDNVDKGAVTTYPFYTINANHTIDASFVPDTYTITATAGTGGSINPSGATPVAGGGSQSYTITPDPGYKILYVAVNGASVGAVTSYTFTNVNMNYTIAASFVPITYAITVTQTANGYITPYTFENFQAGANQTYTIAPIVGYHVDSLTVDGNAVNPPVTSYPFTNIQANHTITATFAPN